MSSLDYRDFWTVPVDDVPAKTGAAGVMDCADILDVLAHLDLDLRGKYVLDVGCGTGRVAGLCDHYTGCDVSPSMVAYAKQQGCVAQVIEGPADVIGMSRDIIVCLSVFTHIAPDERRAYLRAFRKITTDLLVDILPGQNGGSIAAWYTDPAEFELDLHDTGFDTITDTYQRVSADGHTHLYYHCR